MVFGNLVSIWSCISVSAFGSKFISSHSLKMVQKLNVEGYAALKDAIEVIDKKKEINIYFSGTKNDAGVSWCPDCVLAEPYVLAAVDKFAKADSVFIFVDVGSKAFWRELSNPFRTDNKIAIQVIPTLMRWKAPHRLEGGQCEKNDLLEMFFTDDVSD